MTPPLKPRRRLGVSLVELLCVIAILAILVSINLGAIARASKRIRDFLAHF